MSLAEYNDPGTERSVSDQWGAANSAQDDLRSGKEAGRTLGQDCGRVAEMRAQTVKLVSAA